MLSVKLSVSVSELVKEVLRECGGKYGFDWEEAYKGLSVELLGVNDKKNVKKSDKKGEKKVEKSDIMLPFCGDKKEGCCAALKLNGGLYTQCEGKTEVDYCDKCMKQMQKLGAEYPEYGRVEDRMKAGLYEYEDKKGRKPTHYRKIMEKKNWSREMVEEAASKAGMVVPEMHFAERQEETKRGRPKVQKDKPEGKGKRGRPAKTTTIMEAKDASEDTFNMLVRNTQEEKEEKLVEEVAVEAVKEAVVEAVKETVVEEVKEVEEVAVEEYKSDADKVADMLSDEESTKAEPKKRGRRKQTEEEKAIKKAEKDAAKKAEKEKKEAEKKAEKERKELEKKKETKKVEVAPVINKPEEEADDVLERLTYKGVMYVRSLKTNLVYDRDIYLSTEELELVGRWIPEESKLEFNHDDEMSDEEYDD